MPDILSGDALLESRIADRVGEFGVAGFQQPLGYEGEGVRRRQAVVSVERRARLSDDRGVQTGAAFGLGP
jgi:hypothetical protein